MKTASVKELKEELKFQSPVQLVELCLRLSKFKKENKQLLTYLLFEASNETAYISAVKQEMDIEFEQINKDSVYYIKKSARKILRHTKTHIRYSKMKETEVELLIHYCSRLKKINSDFPDNIALQNIFNRQIALIKKAMQSLHEDLRFDYKTELEELV